MFYYGLEFHDLAPNSILDISVFIIASRAYFQQLPPLSYYFATKHFAGSESGDRHRAERVLELGSDVVSVLDRSGREDVRLHQPRCHNASAFGLRGYMDTLSSLVAMLLLDRSSMIVGFFF